MSYTMLYLGLLLLGLAICIPQCVVSEIQLQFNSQGQFKILQVADMHHGNGKTTRCENVEESQQNFCTDLNTTAFLNRIIQAEKPDLIVFTGDNIFGHDAKDAVASMNAAFEPAVASNIPWAAVLGNHDQESTLSREKVMKYIISMKNTVSHCNPTEADGIDGHGNYNLEVGGVRGSDFEANSVLNLYLLDSGDYSTVHFVPGYGWIKDSQRYWFQITSDGLKRNYKNSPPHQNAPAPGLVYFHIPLPEFKSLDVSHIIGDKQEPIQSPELNSCFFRTMVDTGDVKAVFVGHDHINDFCGSLNGIHLCYGGGFGYHAYGKVGWARRARVVLATLEKTAEGEWGPVKSITTWKRLDDHNLSTKDIQVLWSKSSSGNKPFKDHQSEL